MEDNNRIKLTDLDQKVKNLGFNPDDMIFISDSQDVTAVKENLYYYVCCKNHKHKTAEFDAFFVIVEDGEYSFLAGIEGIIPYNDKFARIIIPACE